MKRFLPVAVLILLLLPVLGLAPGTQTDAQGAERSASLLPEVASFADRPTVEPSAEYDLDRDVWRVAFVEEASGSTVARVEVADDTGEPQRVDVSPEADNLTYPDLSEGDAIKLATAVPEVRQELLKHPPYTTRADYDDGEWTVHFEVEEEGSIGGMPVGEDGQKEVARVGVDDRTWETTYVWTGDQVGWHMARGDYGAYGKQANYWYVWGTLAFVFAAAFWRTEKLLSLRNLDVLAILGFLVSHGFFRAGDSYWAVLLWYPPLLYLFGRTLLMGFGIGERVEKTSGLPAGVLFVLGALASGFLLALNLDSRVIDVGYAGVVGADRILDGTLPYGNMPDDVGTGDTYGPLNYLVYVPFNLIFGFSGQWDFLPSAHGATVFAFIVAAAALLVAGWRYAGPKGSAALFFAWAVFPYTLYATNNNTNDVIVAAVMAVGLAVATLPIGRGAAIAAGFATKLFPLVLAPLWMLHDGVEKRSRILDFILGGMAVVVLSFWVLALDGNPLGGARLFYEKTLAFQGTRETPWTIFTQVPSLAFLQSPIEFGAVLLAFVVAVFPRRRTVRRLAAFSAALIVAFQLTFNYWFYPYVIWFAPFVFLALLVETNNKTALDGHPQAGGAQKEDAASESEPAALPRRASGPDA